MAKQDWCSGHWLRSLHVQFQEARLLGFGDSSQTSMAAMASTNQAPLMWLRYDRGPARTWELIRGAAARPGAVTLAAGLALRSFGAGSLRCDLVSEVGGKNRLPIQRTCLRNQMPCMIHPRPASKTMSKLLWVQGLSIKPFWIFRFSVLQHTASIICSEGDCYSGSSSGEHWWLRPPRRWAHALRPK